MEQNGPTDNQHQARTLRTIPVTVISFTKIQLKSNSRTTRVTSRSRHQYTGLNGVTPQKPVIFRNRTRYWNHCATHCHIVRRSFTHKQEIRNSLLHLLLPSSFITHFFFLAHCLLYCRRGSLTSFLLSYVSLFIFCSFRLSQRVPA